MSHEEAPRSLLIVGLSDSATIVAGRWASDCLGWPCIDFSEQTECNSNEEASNYQVPLQDQLVTVQALLEQRPTRHIFVLSNRLITIADTREIIDAYRDSGGHVVFVIGGDQNEPCAEKNGATNRSNSSKASVMSSEDCWYAEIIDFRYYISNGSVVVASSQPPESFTRLIRSITRRGKHVRNQYTKLDRSFFVSLTLSTLEGAEDQVRAACEGVQLVELRVDLLAKQETTAHFHEFVVRQFQILRELTDLDVIYTVRTKAQAGTWPDDDVDGLFGLYKLGLSVAPEFLDVELHLDFRVIDSVFKRKEQTSLLASHHDPAGRLSWQDGSWLYWYEKGLKYGDVIKLVGTAKDFGDNMALEAFRKQAHAVSDIPLIAINMGTIGQLSRILNAFMTPVSHATLAKAAPGQLSAIEIRQAMELIGLTA